MNDQLERDLANLNPVTTDAVRHLTSPAARQDLLTALIGSTADRTSTTVTSTGPHLALEGHRSLWRRSVSAPVMAAASVAAVVVISVWGLPTFGVTDGEDDRRAAAPLVGSSTATDGAVEPTAYYPQDGWYLTVTVSDAIATDGTTDVSVDPEQVRRDAIAAGYDATRVLPDPGGPLTCPGGEACLGVQVSPGGYTAVVLQQLDGPAFTATDVSREEVVSWQQSQAEPIAAAARAAGVDGAEVRWLAFSQLSTGLVSGRLQMVGGPALDTNPLPIVGLIEWQTTDGDIAGTVATGDDGRFALTLPPGRYRLTADSPESGDPECSVTAAITITGGGSASADIECWARGLT